MSAWRTVYATLNYRLVEPPGMEFDRTRTAAVFVAIIALGTAALLAMPGMGPGTVLTMVLPSMVVFGLVCLWLGVRYGEYRA